MYDHSMCQHSVSKQLAQQALVFRYQVWIPLLIHLRAKGELAISPHLTGTCT